MRHVKPLVGGLLVFLCMAFLIGLALQDNEGKMHYQKLEDEAASRKESHSLTQFSQQKREGVSKEMWLIEEEPKRVLIKSLQSELFFFQEDKEVTIIEQLKGVKCFIREDKKSIRYLEAKEASYNYSTHLFVAVDVLLWKYALLGEELPQEVPESLPLMAGKAESVEFLLDEQKINLRAYHLKASFEEHS